MVLPCFLSLVTGGIEATFRHQPLKALAGHLTSRPDLIKGRSPHGEAPHTPSPPPLALNRIRAVAAQS
jgi:hypothetical protein